jgi:hypothetical protein
MLKKSPSKFQNMVRKSDDKKKFEKSELECHFCQNLARSPANVMEN